MIGNRFLDNTTPGRGGALSLAHLAETVVVEANRFSNNYAGQGGAGVYVQNDPSAVIRNNVFSSNIAPDFGAGLHLLISSGVVTNNTFVGNVGKYGGGIAVSGNSAQPAKITNTILWANQAELGPQIYAPLGAGRHPTVSWKAGWQGAGNLDADPLFAGQPRGDFHLTFPSPCLDAGDPLAPGLPKADYEGDPRAAGGFPDLGADEFHTHLYAEGDITPGGRGRGPHHRHPLHGSPRAVGGIVHAQVSLVHALRPLGTWAFPW